MSQALHKILGRNKMWPGPQEAFILVDWDTGKQRNAQAFFGAKEEVTTGDPWVKSSEHSCLRWGAGGRERFMKALLKEMDWALKTQQVAKGWGEAKEVAWESMVPHGTWELL